MTDRRTAILDAALGVLAEQGQRGLTHRAVDTAAGLAAGSTSYYFRTRAALVAGCVDRLVQVDREVAGGPVVGIVDVDAFLDLLCGVGAAMAGRERARTLARYELSLAAIRDPDLGDALAAGGATVRRMCAEALAQLGATDPDESARELLAAFDGTLFAALVRDGTAGFAARLRSVVGAVLRAQPGLAAQRSS